MKEMSIPQETNERKRVKRLDALFFIVHTMNKLYKFTKPG